jgi:hypothetical protein
VYTELTLYWVYVCFTRVTQVEAAHTAARSECAALRLELDSANATLQQLKAQQAEVRPLLYYTHLDSLQSALMLYTL